MTPDFTTLSGQESAPSSSHAASPFHVAGAVRLELANLDFGIRRGWPPWRKTFELARRIRLRAPVVVDPLDVLDALDRDDSIGAPWWIHLGFRSPDDAESQFLKAWEDVRFEQDTLPAAIRWGLANPTLLPRRLRRPRGLAALVACLQRLQAVSHPRPVLVAQVAFARQFGVEQATVSRWLTKLVREHVLSVVDEYWHPSKPNARFENGAGHRHATKYAVHDDAIRRLAEEARAPATPAGAGGHP